MKILVVNAGSSTIKYQLFEGEKVLVRDFVERIGVKGGPKNHHQATKIMFEKLLHSKVIKHLDEIKAVGHRVVHGGHLEKSSIITKEVMKTIKKYSPMAPLHNPAEIDAIRAVKAHLPKVKNIAVFDTAFHHSMPDKAKAYAIPYKYFEKGLKRYGFHGTSHHYVAQRAAKILKKPLTSLNIITCHLGSGASIAAIQKGKVIDTSMGYTPLEGLVMNTRAGDVDPGIIIQLTRKLKTKELDNVLNHKSGLKGICGKADYRDVSAGYEKGDKKCSLAWEMFCYRVKKYIGAYAAALEKVDAIVFTAGGGENLPLMRKMCSNIECLGIKIDDNLNDKVRVFFSKTNPKYKTEGIVSSKDSKIVIMAIGTDEEKMIMLETKRLM